MYDHITQIRNIPNERILQQRAIYRILESERFEQAFSKSTEREKERLFIIVYNSNKELLQLWIKNILQDKNIYELQAEARKLGIYNFSRLSKESLIYHIERIKKNASSKEEYSRQDSEAC